MKSIVKLILACALACAPFIASPAQANFAKTFTSRFGNTVKEVYVTPADVTTSLPTAIGRIINIIVSFAGIILLVIVVYASFLWLTARGDDAQVQKAKNWIRNAVIGLIITMGAFTITSFIVNQVETRLRATINPTSTRVDESDYVTPSDAAVGSEGLPPSFGEVPGLEEDLPDELLDPDFRDLPGLDD